MGTTTSDHEFKSMGELAITLAYQLTGLTCRVHDRRPIVNIYCESGQLLFEIEGCCPALIESSEARVVVTDRVKRRDATVRRIA